MTTPNYAPPGTTALVAPSPPEPESATLAELLQNVPLHSPRTIQRLFTHPALPIPALPDAIDLHCANPKCNNGLRRHALQPYQKEPLHSGDYCYHFLKYAC